MDTKCIDSRIPLNDGNSIPVLGLGTWMMRDQEMNNVVSSAVKEGYRLVDIAQLDGNAGSLAKAIKECGLPRNQLFIVSKLLPENHGYKSTKTSFRKCLNSLGLEYIDLFLIHSPHGGKIIETWKALIELKEKGLTRSIGVSNFNVRNLESLSLAGLQIPAVNQIELHPWNQYKSVVKYCKERNIALMAYCPLAKGDVFGSPQCEIIDQLAEKYNKTAAQILLRWSVQSGFIPIPKSSNSSRIKENGDVFGWALSDEDMETVEGMDAKAFRNPWNIYMLDLED